MTAFNRENYIAQAIESVSASTYKNFELIIVDDCSSDNTLTIAKGFATVDGRIKVFLNEANLGDYQNRNKAASYANGEFIMYVDSDDLLLNETIEKCVALMAVNPSVNFGIYYPEVGIDYAYTVTSDSAIKRQYFVRAFLQVGPGGIFMRRSFFEFIGKFPEKYGPANDMYFNVKAASKSDVLIFPFPLIFYRRHEAQEVNDQYSYIYYNFRYNRDLIMDLELPLTDSEKKYILKKNQRRFAVNAMRFFLKTRDFKKTSALFKKASFGVKDFFKGVFH